MNKLLSITLLFLGSSDSLFASPGDLDPSFDVDGKATVDFGADERITGVAIQPDGKIVVVGSSGSITDSPSDFALVRFNADGTLDNTFDGDGKLTTDFSGRIDRAKGVVLQPDGKIVVAGSSRPDPGNDDFALARYNTDGSLDLSFDGDGKVTTDFSGSGDDAWAVVLQSDGRIVAIGNTTMIAGADFALVRYNSDGSLDLSFGFGGKVTTDFNGNSDQAFSAVLQPDGKIVAAGNAYTGQAWDFGLARYNSDGSLDTGFGGDGKVTTQFSSNNDWANGVVLQTDGKIVAAGWANAFDFALARYDPDGSLDSTFDGDGMLTTDFFGQDEEAHAVTIQPDGKIIAVGQTYPINSPDFALVRYNVDGSLDSSFDIDGRVTTDFGSGGDVATAIVLQTDGKIVVAGQTDTGSSYDFAIARYQGDDQCLSFCDDFEDGVLASDWTYAKPQWTEAGGSLIGSPVGRKAEAVATPVFLGCALCTVQAAMTTDGGIGNRLWLLAWYEDKGNTIELLMKEENDKWVLKQRSGGSVVAKTKGLATILPNASYNVEILFDGSTFTLVVDGTALATLPAFSAPNGTVGFRAKSTTGRFGFITVN